MLAPTEATVHDTDILFTHSHGKLAFIQLTTIIHIQPSFDNIILQNTDTLFGLQVGPNTI